MLWIVVLALVVVLLFVLMGNRGIRVPRDVAKPPGAPRDDANEQRGRDLDLGEDV
jgi:hypothetical protein